MSAPKPFLLTMGDPAGVGPELIALLCRDQPALAERCLVVGDAATLARACACIGSAPLAIPVIQATSLPAPVPWGQVSAEAGRAAADCITWATREVLAGRAAGVVTAPIHKEALAAAGVSYPGHTEMLQALAAEHLGLPMAQLPVRMMLANPELKTVLVSIHVSLRQAIDAVTQDNVLQTVRITAAHWARLGLAPPRIAVAGLNPHAGEGGLFGREEIEVIKPVIDAARARGWQVSGPYPADTLFQPKYLKDADCILAMYHDQGLPVLKFATFGQGVNITLGLPIIRTSVDHGTALDIAARGNGHADYASMQVAIRMAAEMIYSSGRVSA